MAHNDSKDFQYPPGLGFTRTNGDQGRSSNYHESMASLGGQRQGERRLSVGQRFGSYSSQVQPRWMGSLPEREFGFGNASTGSEVWAPNSSTPAASSAHQQLNSFNHNHNHQRRASPPSPFSPSLPVDGHSVYHTPATSDRDAYALRSTHRSPASSHFSPAPASQANPPALNIDATSSRSILWWGDLEPWMDDEYAKQVCSIMGWDPVSIKVPHPAPDTATGQQANNPGYCFLTFPSPHHAASVLAQINNTGGGTKPVTMPNSNKPFVLNWASSVPNTPLSSTQPPSLIAPAGPQPQFAKEYSIFVGDLAPETSNSDLVAVFRNPVLGLRNDREPKFIRPFLSCKSAKIMLDPVTGVSRGYGFVRFTDEADQQRALIEMHGLYCLSRPMRISPATAKFKPSQPMPGAEYSSMDQTIGGMNERPSQQQQSFTIALPLPNATQAKSVSAPIAAISAPSTSPPPSATNSAPVSVSNSSTSMAGSSSVPSLSSGGSSNTVPSVASEESLNLPPHVLAHIAQQYANSAGGASPSGSASKSGTNPAATPFVQEAQGQPRYTISEESWKHHAQARAILGNLMGPNGEQLTSTDPYNTTVFVGGLSPLISEETLRTFFAPFGDIHYVKVPVGKHCGFVQFVRKADAENAIEKMQGFPVGGSRIRLSWGRSQYKAAQAAAQAAQAAAFQNQTPPAPATSSALNGITPEHAYQLLQKFGLGGPFPYNGEVSSAPTKQVVGFLNAGGVHEEHRAEQSGSNDAGAADDSMARRTSLDPRASYPPKLTSFSPFSPDPALYHANAERRDSAYPRNDLLPHPSQSYAPGFGPESHDEWGVNHEKVSPTSTRPSSAGLKYAQYNRPAARSAAAISRPSSSHMASQDRAVNATGPEHDPIHDLNGTLASLDLDQTTSWRSGHEGVPAAFRGRNVHESETSSP